MSDTGPSGTSGGVSDSDGGLVRRRSNTDGGGDASATSGAVSRASGESVSTSAPTTTISTIAVQSGGTRIVLALLQSGDWLELRVVELSPGLVYLGSTLEEATALQQAHHEVLTKLQSKQSPVEDLLNQADQLISTQRPRAEVYAAMAESLGFAWRDLNIHLETRKNLLDLSVAFHTRARQYSDALDAAEKTYTDNVMPSDVEGARALLVSLHDHKRAILEASMFTLQEAQVLLGRLKGLLQEGGSMDSRPQHIRTNIEFACSQIEHYLESLHDRRRFLDGLFIARKHHLEQCVTLCILYQDLTEAILNLKKLRDEISEHQELGESQANAEILLHEHLRRENTAKAQQDQCVRHVRTTEQMVASGHYAGAEARARAYSVLEAATALHETCDTRTALLQQSALFFRLANGALTKLDQAEVQIAALSSGGGNQRLSVVMGVVEEAVQPALTEGYALLEVTGGRGQPHNEGVTKMVEQLENRRTRLASLCADSTEKDLQRTELINSFLEMYNAIESWLVKIGDSFLRGHQDPGGSLSLAKDFLHLHLTLKNDLADKEQEIVTLSAFLDQLSKELSGDELSGYKEKVEGIKHHWASLKDILDSRIAMSEKYVKFHEDSEQIYNQFEELEGLLKTAKSEADNVPIEKKWKKIQDMYRDLDVSGKYFIKMAKEIEYPYLDVNRAILCIEYILENLGKRKLVVTDLFTHYQKKVSVNKELSTLWNTYRENLKKMELEMYNLEVNLCPLLRGDSSNPQGLALSLEKRLNNYVKALKKIQEEIENMVTKAEGLAHSDAIGAERPDIVRALLQLYQNLQNKVTDYQILGTMLIQWCNNIAEVHRSCDKLEKQFGTISVDVGGVERQLKEHEASKHAVTELLKFAQHEADAIIQKIMTQCPREPGNQDIAKMKEMLERRKEVMEFSWKERQVVLEKQLKRSQYQTDLKVIRDQLRDLSDQLGRMKGHYGDSLNAALNMKTAFIQFKMTVETLGRRIENFVSTAEKMLLGDDDAKEIQLELSDLQNKWSTFHMQVGESQKSIDLSIEFFKLVQETESWFKEGSQLLITVAGESSHIQNPEEARRLQQKIESFLTPGETDQENRITKITSLAVLLYGDTTPQQVEAVSQQNQYMLDSFNVINKNLATLMKNLKEAEQQRQNQEKEQQELAASLAQAQAEAESARLAALAAEEARRVAEETVTAMAMHKIPSETVEVVVQTEEVSGPETVTFEEYEKKVTMTQEEILRIPPMFLTPLVGATVSEGVKFTFECRVTGDPVPDVVWLKDGLSIMSNPDYKTSFDGKVCSLTIEETFTEDSALFTCKATNVAGKAESSANLLVKEAVPTEIMSPPVFTKGLVDCTPQEGTKFQLEATVTGHPLPVVSWAKNGVCIDNSPDYNLIYNNGECVLRFEELFLEDSAEYTCRATNDLGDDMTRARLTVLAEVTSEPPSFVIPLSNLMARAGQKFKLECEVRGTPTPTLAWFHNNKPVKETPDCRISFDGSRATLVISEAFPKNAGKYTLLAKNTAGEAQTSSNVSVKGRIPTETSDSEITSDIDAEPVKPSIQQSLKDISANEGEAIRLDCIIIGQPEPEVIWYHDDKPVKESEDIRLLFHGDRCSLVIHEALMEDVGTYKVVAMNSAGEASTSCFVNVLAPEKPDSPVPEVEVPTESPVPVAEPPRFSLLLVDSHVLEGGSTSMSAAVSGSPKPTIAWFKDGVPLLPDDQLQIYEEPEGYAKIYIPHASLDHTGQYEVVASNSAGTAKCVGFLSIEPRLPSPPPPEPQEPPVFSKLLKDTSIQSGDSVLFEAVVNGVPKPSVYWTLNESPVNEYEYLHGVKQYTVAEDGPGKHFLNIACSTRGQDGRVSIIAENEAGRAVSSCRLHVLEPPVPTQPVVSEGFERRTVVSETHVTKFVSSSVNDELPSKHSFTASSTSRVSSSTGQPTVEEHGSLVQQLDQDGSAAPEVKEKVNLIKVEGEKVVEQVSKESSSVRVSSPPAPPLVKKAAKRRATPACFVAPLQGIILKEHERALFECVIDGYPEPSIEWSHNRGPLPEEAVPASQGNRVSLVIPRVTQSHGGRYTCTIQNEAGTAQCTCDLVVRKIQFPPVFSKRLQPSVIGVGERLHLEIDVSGTPTPQVSWSKNGQPLQSNESLTIKTEGTRSWLVIPEAQESDSGRYGVTASNGAGRSECLADVMVTSLTICEPTKTIVFTDVSDDSRYYSSTKTEEFYEKRTESEGPDIKKREEKSQHERRKPKFEEFRRDTRGTPDYGPFSEDTFYSMSDESEVMTDKGKKKSKVEMKTESHVQVMSDKKSEYYSYSSGGEAEKPKKESPKSKKKRSFKTVETTQQIKTPSPTFHAQEQMRTQTTIAPKHERKIEIQLSQEEPKPKPKPVASSLLEEKTKSLNIVKQEVTRQGMDKDLDLKPFPFKPEQEKPKKQRGPPPPQPKKFVKGEFHESDYGSDYESKILPVWKGPESDAEEPYYSKVEIPKVERKMFRQQRSPTPPSKYDPYPKFDDSPRPVIEFPDSEPEVKESILTSAPKIIKKKPDIPKIVPKQELIVSRAPQPTKHERTPSPVLQREPTPEEGYIKPPPKHTPFSNAVGVESTKITKIEDSSQYHKRFVTMEQTTRVIKLSDSQASEVPKKPKATEEVRKYTKKPKVKPEDTHKYEFQEKVERVIPELPSIQMKPMPKLEPFPFTPDPPRPRKDRGSPPPTPKKFIKGEMRDSEYDSDSDLLIKSKWHPPDSDVDEPVYGKVSVPVSPKVTRKPTKARERTPTPPSVFDKPPPLGEPMRPLIEPIEFIVEKEPSPDYMMPIEVSFVDEKTLAKNLVTKEQSPPLPPPGTPPEEGIIVKKTEYVVDGINIETKTAPPTMKAIPTVKKKPFREIIEKTERKITDKKFTEERTFKTGKIEIVKTTVTDLSSDEQEEPRSRKLEIKSSLEDISHPEPSPHQIERRPFIRETAPPPPQPMRFLKQEIEETAYSDQEQKIPALWKPHDSDTDEPSYTKVEVSLPTTKRASRDERTPTPPSKFDKGPPDSVIMRKTTDTSVTKTEEKLSYVEKRSEHKYVQPQTKPRPIKTTEKVEVKKYRDTTLPEPGPKPVIGFIKPEPTVEVPPEPVHKPELSKKSIDINIDIVDVYDYVSESESERVYSDIGSYKSFPDLEPFPYAPEPPRPKRERGHPPPMPKKFMKGEFRESDYDSETDGGRIPPKWCPTDSEGEGLEYRKVKAPSSPVRKVKSEETGRVPSPPSKFDQPPSFEGPPRPVVDFQDIPRRERRESLEEYSIPKFPKVEFKPFDLDDDETTKVKLTHTTDTETDTESMLKKTATKKYVESTQKYVGEQFSDMNLNFRDKAQKFAEQLVSEVFATRDGSSKMEHAEQPSHIGDIIASSSEKIRQENGLDFEEPQAYRDESRLSEFGSKHIDPNTGLIYFKYDFGYEFGIILPGEGKKVERSRSVPPGKKNGDIEIPVIHIRSDDESNYQKKPRTGIPRRDIYDQYREKTALKKSGQLKSYGVCSDSESDTRVKKMASTFADSKSEDSESLPPWQQKLPDQEKGPMYQLSSPSLVSSASASTAPKLPAFITPLKDQSATCGQELRLECVVRSNIPPRITWFKDGFPLTGNPRCQELYRNGVCRLVLHPVQPEDSGHYTCSAENAVGESCTSNIVTVYPGEIL